MTSKPHIRLVITDLDNTLYDWVTYFVSAFYGMIEVASRLLDADQEKLLDDIREVHQRNHDSEQAFALLETKTVLERYGKLSRFERMQALDEAFHKFNSIRDKTLKLYPGVLETLETINKSGCRAVAHTEANLNNAMFRMQKMNIEKFLQSLYALEDHGEGHPDPTRKATFAQPCIKVRRLDSHERKPDVRVLLEICKDYQVHPSEALYIGDSISRDIGMAKSAGVWSAWARYGTSYDAALWKKLVRITHWTQEDVVRAEQAQKLYGHVKPDVTLETSFREVLEHFSF